MKKIANIITMPTIKSKYTLDINDYLEYSSTEVKSNGVKIPQHIHVLNGGCDKMKKGEIAYLRNRVKDEWVYRLGVITSVEKTDDADEDLVHFKYLDNGEVSKKMDSDICIVIASTDETLNLPTISEDDIISHFEYCNKQTKKLIQKNKKSDKSFEEIQIEVEYKSENSIAVNANNSIIFNLEL